MRNIQWPGVWWQSETKDRNERIAEDNGFTSLAKEGGSRRGTSHVESYLQGMVLLVNMSEMNMWEMNMWEMNMWEMNMWDMKMCEMRWDWRSEILRSHKTVGTVWFYSCLHYGTSLISLRCLKYLPGCLRPVIVCLDTLQYRGHYPLYETVNIFRNI